MRTLRLILAAFILLPVAACTTTEGGAKETALQEIRPERQVELARVSEPVTKTIPAPEKADNKKLIARCESAIDKGIRFLTKSQNKDGSYGKRPCVGITGLCVRAMAESHRKYREKDGPFMSKAVDYMLENVQKDGGIYNENQGVENYRTCVAIGALASLNDPEHKKVISDAGLFVAGLQCSEDSGYDPDKHAESYGGIGYGGDQRPDIANTLYAVEALKEAGVPEDSPVWERVQKFLSRCQHNTEGEGNDQVWATDAEGLGGGFVYMPGNSKAGDVKLTDGREVPRPYGSATYMGIRSLLYADVDKNDPRIQSAHQWIEDSFTVEENPGTGQQGVYFYYSVMARCLSSWGDRHVVPAKGEKRDWAGELSTKLSDLQRDDGSWVNDSDRWWEGDPALVTAYSIIALNNCIDTLRK